MILSGTITISREEYQNLINENIRLKEEVAALKFELNELKRMLFGSKKERFVSNQDGQQMLDLQTEIKPVEPSPKETITITRSKKQTKKQSVRSSLPSHLPRVEEVIEPENIPEGSKKIGELVTEVLEYDPGKVYIRRIVRPKYALPKEEGIVTAQLPAMPISKGNAGAGLLAHLFVSKFVDHQPFYRQVQIFKREGIDFIAESTISGWLNQVCNLLAPLYEKLKTRILQSGYVMADETPLAVLSSDKPGSTHRGYHWVYYSPPVKLVYFDYRKSRGREGPEEFFKGYKGAIQTDGYAAYDIFDKSQDIQLLACMAHARRKFEHSLDNDKTLSEFALNKMQELYLIERKAKEEQLSPEQRYLLRQEKSAKVLSELEKWMKEQQPLLLPKSSIAGAIAYTLNLWERLNRYITNGIYEIDNNLIENSIRPVALGRKNYLFAGSHEGAERAAMMYSFFGSCKINGVNPFDWLKFVLKVIPDYKANQLANLLPDNWLDISSKN